MSTSYCRAYRHERSKGPAALKHHLAHVLNEFPSSLAVPKRREATEQRSRGHAHAETDREAHFDAVPAAGSSLETALNGHGHVPARGNRVSDG